MGEVLVLLNHLVLGLGHHFHQLAAHHIFGCEIAEIAQNSLDNVFVANFLKVFFDKLAAEGAGVFDGFAFFGRGPNGHKPVAPHTGDEHLVFIRGKLGLKGGFTVFKSAHCDWFLHQISLVIYMGVVPFPRNGWYAACDNVHHALRERVNRGLIPARKDIRMARGKKIYEGKAKILFEGPEPGTIVQYFKDDATAFNAEKQSVIDGKGVLNNRLSEYFMVGLNQIGVPTHFLKRLNMREQLVRNCEIIPLEVIVRNYAAGSMSKRLGIEEGTQLPRPIVEYCYKDDSLGDPLVSEEHIAAFGWASQQDMDDILGLALRVNDYMSGVMYGVGIKLVDFKIEIGRVYEGDFQRLVVADEISPDSCRLWDIESGQKLDKDVFRRDLGSLTDAYAEVARRLGVMPKGTGPKPTLVN